MRLNQRFRRLVFSQVLLGIVSFSIAERNPGMLLIAGAMAVLSWYLTEGPAGRSLPRWVINLLSLGAVAWLMMDLFSRQVQVVIAMGHFTMWLQILLLYTDKSNREYGQLLVLSLMTMIGASILSVSMVYGVLLAAYCVLGLITLLHFHFKTTWDHVTEAMKAAAPRGTAIVPPKPTIGRGYTWHLRFAAVSIGFVCTAVAVAVFVVTPRSGDPRGRSNLTSSLRDKQTGFSETVNLSGGAPGPGSQEPVLNMVLTLHGEAVTEPWVFLLRGASLDEYDPRTRTWRRSHAVSGLDRMHPLPESGWRPVPVPEDSGGSEYEARITLRQGGLPVLFAHLPTTYVSSPNFTSVSYNAMDGQLSGAEVVPGAVVYHLRWPLQPLRVPSAPPSIFDESASSDPQGTERERRQREMRIQRQQELADTYARGWPDGARQRIANYVNNLLAPHRQGLAEGEELSEAAIVRILENHLREQFEYSLENPPAPAGADPVADFLFNQRRGHCELFASGLAAMVRSIGMKARVITGYRASEYNTIGGYYVVRQDDAHAWTEIDLGPEHGGWRTFDATPPAAVRAEHAVTSNWFSTFRQIYEAIEYEWIRSVVAFDQRTRTAVMEDLKASVGTPTDRSSWLGGAWNLIRNLREVWVDQKLNYTLIFFIVIVISIAVASLARTLVIRRRRLVALQLTALPRAKRRGLASKLRFYLTMLDMLERHGYIRPSWQSPFSFAQELAEANPLRFDPVVALTEIFYEIRFGHREVDSPRKDRIKAHLKQLESALGSS